MASHPPPAKKSKGEFQCDTCGNTYAHRRSLEAHKRTHDPHPQHQCQVCNKVFVSQAALMRHANSVHYVPVPRAAIRATAKPERRSLPEQDPADPLAVPDVAELLDQERDSFADVYHENWPLIKTEYLQQTTNRIVHLYNLRLPNTSISTAEFVERVHENQDFAYSLNVHVGYITLDVETGQYHYFWPGDSSKVFDDDIRINNPEDLRQFQEKLNEHDMYQWAQLRRHSTKCSIQLVTNITVVVVVHREIPIQGFRGKLPPYIRNRKCINPLDTSVFGTPHDDNLCVFRCLALHREAFKRNSVAVDKSAERLAQAWFGHKGIFKEDFKGIQLHELQELETFFKTPIYVYQLQPWIRPMTENTIDVGDDGDAEQEDDELFPDDLQLQKNVSPEEEKRLIDVAMARDEFIAELVRRPDKSLKAKDVPELFLNLYEEESGRHFSYINCFVQYAKCYRCPMCDRVDHDYTSSKRHSDLCNGNIQKHLYPGYSFTLNKNVFELLDEESDPELRLYSDDLRYYPFVSTFDFECYSRNLDGPVFESLEVDSVPALLPEPDPPIPDYNIVDNFVAQRWNQLKSTYSTPKGTWVVRCDAAEMVSQHVKAIARLQSCRFTLSVNLLVKRNTKLIKLQMFCSKTPPIVFNPSTLKACLELVSTGEINQKLGRRGDSLLAIEVRVHSKKLAFTKHLEAASVSIASNIPGHVDDLTGLPIPDFILSNGDTQDMIRKFVDKLNQLSDEAVAHLRPLYQPIFDKLKSKILVHSSNVERIISPILELHDVAPKSFFKQLEYCRNSLSCDDIAYLRHEKEEESRLCVIQRMLEDYITHLPVVGFNSGAFDLMLVRRELLPLLIKERDESQDKNSLSVLRKDGSSKYLQIKTSRLSFLDQSQYLAAGTSYSAWLAAYHIEQKKGHFPHDFFSSLDLLKLKRLPDREAFYNELKNEELSQADYDELQGVWISNNFQSLADLLKWYNNLDTVPFVLASLKMMEWFKTKRQICLYKDGMSIPGLALLDLVRHADDFTYLVTEQKTKEIDNSDLHDLITENIVGGPSIVWQRHLKVGETILRAKDNGTEVCQEIVGFDMASLYLWATSQKQGTGIPRRYKRLVNDPEHFSCKSMYPNCRAELEWLSWLQYKYNLTHKDKIKISHRFNSSQQTRIAGSRVDGAVRSKRLVFQFNGCAFHGCPDPNCKIKPILNATELAKRQAQDKRIRTQIEAAGYTVTTIQYCEWMKLKKANADLREFLKENFDLPPVKSKMTQADILQRIKDDKFFGVALVDIHTPDTKELRDKFKEFCPIMKNVNLSREQIGPVMREYAEKHDYMKTPRRSLVSSYFGKRILLSTPLLHWYLHNGLEVTHLYEAVEYKGRAVFKRFADEVTEARRSADRGGISEAILAALFKLLGNSCYGKTLTRVERHKKFILCNRRKFSRLSQSPRYSQVDEITDDLLEVSMCKSKVVHKLPRMVGFQVYQYAKLRMLQFYHNCIDRYVARKDFELAFMDTDSLYLGLSAKTLDEVIKKDMREEWERERYNFFPDPQLGKWATRIPAIANTEFKDGQELVALNSKTYFIQGKTKNKRSSKGVPLRNKLTIDDYRGVLQSKEPVSALIKGFRRLKRGGPLSRYDMSRFGLVFMYAKREILEDLTSTVALKDV